MEPGSGRHGQGRLGVAGSGLHPQDLSRWSRVSEWSLLLAVVVVLVMWLAQQSRALQAQGELAAVRSTLGTLRTALVLSHLQAAVAAGRSDVLNLQRHQANPFVHLARAPVNYLGERVWRDNARLAKGTWVFDPVCVCVGYTPQNEDWFDSVSGAGMAWFEVKLTSGIWQLTAREKYSWRGEVLE